jgi:hypothetical protein
MDRSSYIGGSDAAALVGSNKYKTVLSVWERLRGEKQPEVSGGHIERGNDLEPYIEDWIRENRDPTINSKELVGRYDGGDESDQIFLQHPEDERLAGHPDGIGEGSVLEGSDKLWEIKAPTSYAVENIRRHGLPSRYKWQVQWYMHLANQIGSIDEALVCVWDCDEWNNPIIVSVPYNEKKGEELIGRARDLLFAAEMGEKPAAATFGEVAVQENAGEDMDRILREYQEVKSLEKTLKEERKRLKAQIVSRADGVNTVQTENNLARLQYNWGQYDATRLSVTER